MVKRGSYQKLSAKFTNKDLSLPKLVDEYKINK